MVMLLKQIIMRLIIEVTGTFTFVTRHVFLGSMVVAQTSICSFFLACNRHYGGLPRRFSGKESVCQCRRCRRLGFNPWAGKTLEKAMAPHSSTLAWEIPSTEEPGGLQSRGSRRVGHDSTNAPTQLLSRVLYIH